MVCCLYWDVFVYLMCSLVVVIVIITQLFACPCWFPPGINAMSAPSSASRKPDTGVCE